MQDTSRGVLILLAMSFPPPPRPYVPPPRLVPGMIVGPPPGAPSSRLPPRERRGHGWAIRVAIASALVACLGVGAGLARARYLPTSAVLPGLRIDGEEVPAGADDGVVRALVERRAADHAARKVLLVVAGHDRPARETTLGALGVRVDVEETLATARRVGRAGDLLSRAEAAEHAREGKLDVPLRVVVQREVALRELVALKESEDTQPVSARLDLAKHATIPERDGRYVDADAVLGRLEGAARDVVAAVRAAGKDAVVVEMPVASFAPRISSEFLKQLDIGAVVAEYETYFSRGGDQRLRGKNIENAAQKLDGLVVSPGEMISFNEVIGERSEANGFQKSWEIFKGEMVEGVGGGTCQVASTFYAATFFGGFDVLERLPHSRPSAYIPMGLDSTVVFPAVDLKVRNPHPFPVVVHAKTEGGKLRVELLGKMRPVRVTFEREVEKVLPYKRKIVEEGTLFGKKVRVKQHGIQGYKVKRERLLVYPDGTRRKETATDFYPPTTEIYEVPAGFDVSLLPPLPGGEAEDEDLGESPAPPPASLGVAGTETSSPIVATASTEVAPAPAGEIELVDAPGAHAPTAAQARPPKTMTLRR